MRTIILSLQDAVETGLKDIDLLEKQDKVIFVYLKGKDTISIPVHNALSQLKCKTEFYEIPDENAKKEDMLIYFAYLAGSNPGAAIIDTGAMFTKLTYLGIRRFADFKSLANGKSVRKPKETVTGEQPVRKRKPRIIESPAFNAINAPVEKRSHVLRNHLRLMRSIHRNRKKSQKLKRNQRRRKSLIIQRSRILMI